jgi:hypothetical protein
MRTKVANEKTATFGITGFKDTVSRDFSAMVFFIYIEHLHPGSFFTPHSVFACNFESTNIFESKLVSNKKKLLIEGKFFILDQT